LFTRRIRWNQAVWQQPFIWRRKLELSMKISPQFIIFTSSIIIRMEEFKKYFMSFHFQLFHFHKICTEMCLLHAPFLYHHQQHNLISSFSVTSHTWEISRCAACEIYCQAYAFDSAVRSQRYFSLSLSIFITNS
jgi:hypothetical protein